MEEITLEQLLEEEKETRQRVEWQRRRFLKCQLSVAVEHCFHAANKWSYNKDSLRNYLRYINELGKDLGVLSLDEPVEILRKESTLVVKRLLDNKSLSDMQKKLRMHALMFLFQHLSEITGGGVKPLMMPPELNNIHSTKDEKKTAASYAEAREILLKADSINTRDCLVLKLVFQTEKSLQHILNIECNSLNYKERHIKGMNNIIDEETMSQLKEYVESTKKIRGDCPKVFISNQGKPLYRTQVQKTLDKANQIAQLPYRISSKMIQRSKEYEMKNLET